jgi:hypothetical protein
MGQFWRGCSALPLERSAALNVGASSNATLRNKIFLIIQIITFIIEQFIRQKYFKIITTKYWTFIGEWYYCHLKINFVYIYTLKILDSLLMNIKMYDVLYNGFMSVEKFLHYIHHFLIYITYACNDISKLPRHKNSGDIYLPNQTKLVSSQHGQRLRRRIAVMKLCEEEWRL